MSLKYPEIYDISEIDKWISTYVRKELVTTEWDLISNEVAPDVYQIPFFTEEFCDKLVENSIEEKGQQITLWGHEAEEIGINDSIHEVIKNLFVTKLVHAFFHHWSIDLPTFQRLELVNRYFRLQKNQDLRPRHDSSIITCYIKLDSDSEGGELYFPKYNYTLKPKQGHIYFFPGRVTHRYGINFIKSGINNSLFIYITD